jgi:hypothetical protein
MDPNHDTLEETHLSRHLNRRRQRIQYVQLAFVLGLSLFLVALLEVVLNPGVLDRQAPRVLPSAPASR